MSASTFLRRLFGRLVVAVLILILAGVVWLGVPASVHYHIEEVYSFAAKKQPAKVRLAVMLPRSGPYQTVRGVTASWDGTQAPETRGAVEVLKLEGRVEAGQNKQATVAYDVVLPRGRARWEEPVEETDLRPQKDIESDAPAIAAQAARIASGQSREDAYRIYEFTSAHLSFFWGTRSGTNENQSALRAYQTRVGVCSEFANLMVALCRAAKIPARSISGLDLPSRWPGWSANRVWGHPGVSHAWTEVHTPAGWEMADPTGAWLMPIKSLWFGRNNGRHLSYGEDSRQDKVFEEMLAWAATGGRGSGAMSAPMKFASGADSGEVTVTPQVTVTVTQNARWYYLAGVVGGFIAWRLYSWRQRRKRGAKSEEGLAPRAAGLSQGE